MLSCSMRAFRVSRAARRIGGLRYYSSRNTTDSSRRPRQAPVPFPLQNPKKGPSPANDVPPQLPPLAPAHQKLLNALTVHCQQDPVAAKVQVAEEPEEENNEASGWFGGKEPIMTPREICKHLDDYVIGQEAVKRKVAVALHSHYLRISHNFKAEKEKREGKNTQNNQAVVLDKSNILLIGPSGSGKTLIAKTVAKILDVPFSFNDATPLTQAGYVGEDVEVIIYRLLQNANFDTSLASRGIVFIDEIDKIARRSDPANPNQRDVSGEGVQQGLLRILEGTNVTINVKPGANKRGSGEQYVVDTSNILFVLSGAFVGLDRIVTERLSQRSSIGFGASLKQSEEEQKKARDDWMNHVEPEDLVKYGFIPEFVGRVPLFGVSRPLTESELVRILTEPRNAITRQYQEMFSQFNVKLQFSESALHAIAKEARSRNVGARGLRRIMDTLLADAQFDLPGTDIRYCVVTSDTVNKKSELSLFIDGEERSVKRLLKQDQNVYGSEDAEAGVSPIEKDGNVVVVPEEEISPRRKDALGFGKSTLK